MVKIEFKKWFKDAKLPTRKHDRDAGWDCYAYKFDDLSGTRRDVDSIWITTGKVYLAHLGFAVNIPKGYCLELVPRSGLAVNNGLTVINSPGIIDSGYQNEVVAVLWKNGTDNPLTLKEGDRVCQILLRKVEEIEIVPVNEFSEESDRGLGGFGSTGR